MEELLSGLEKSLKLGTEEIKSEINLEMKRTRSALYDCCDEILEKIGSSKDVKAQEVSRAESDPFVLYEKCGLVGNGVTGDVYRVRDRETNEYFAMKHVWINNNIIPPYLAREISIMYDIQHDNIVKLKKVHPYKSALFLLMELGDVDLSAFLKEGKNVTTDVIKDWLRQILSALDYLHNKGIIHRDLKPENIVVVRSTLELKITDFGNARRLIDAPITPQATTVLFSSPEMLMGDRMYGVAIDVWAVGCIFAEMAGMNDFFGDKHGTSSVLEKIFRKIGKPGKKSKLASLPLYPHGDGDDQESEASDVTLTLIPSLDALGNDLLKQLLTLDPANRITAGEALQHPYIKQQSLPVQQEQSPTVQPSQQEQPTVQPSQQEQPTVQRSQQEQPVEQAVKQEAVHEKLPLEEHQQVVHEKKQQAVHEHMQLRPRNHRPEGHKKVPEITNQYTRRLRNKKNA